MVFSIVHSIHPYYPCALLWTLLSCQSPCWPMTTIYLHSKRGWKRDGWLHPSFHHLIVSLSWKGVDCTSLLPCICLFPNPLIILYYFIILHLSPPPFISSTFCLPISQNFPLLFPRVFLQSFNLNAVSRNF